MELATELNPASKIDVTTRGWPPLGLRQRLILALAVPLVVIAVISAGLDFLVARDTANSVHDAALADAVFDLEAHFRRHENDMFADFAEESEAMARSSAPDRLFFSVKDEYGRQLAGDVGIPVMDTPSGQSVRFFDSRVQGGEVRGAVHRFQSARGVLQVLIMETTKKRRASSNHILSAMVLPNLAVILATIGIVMLGVSKGLKPLKALECEIAARSVSDLGDIQVLNQPTEIRPVVQRLNELFVLLRESQAAQQRFIGDAAHQLRTPLAGLQSHLDLAAQEGIFSGHDERYSKIDEACNRISHLLNQLLSFARAESAATVPLQPGSVALDQLLEKAASLFIDRAVAKQIDLGFEVQHVTVSGQAWLLGEALNNLIDNALRYTSVGGMITVRCGGGDCQPYVEVEDSGPGIPEALLPHVVERFFRVPGAPGDGCGLGLPIVQEIATLHHAHVSLRNLPAGGFLARIEFLPVGQ